MHSWFDNQYNVQIRMDKIDKVERDTPNKTRPDILEEAYTMYTYLSYCPEREDYRLQYFFTDLFENYPNRIIVDQFENMLKGKRASFTEKQLYKKMNGIFNFKSGQITMAASSKQDLLLDLDLDIPQLMSIRKDILSCLHHYNCDEVDTMLKEIGNTKVKVPNFIH